jgi:uncharacterized protein
MSDDLLFQLEQFSGNARLFPLPNLVLFPHVLQPLHVFEARYRALVEDALESDGLIAMALLAPGWENDYEGRPPVHPMACLGRIATHHRLEDGRYNILLAGSQRIRLVRELDSTKPFREAEAVGCQDLYSSQRACQRPALQRRLLDAFRRLTPQADESHTQLESLLASEISLGMLTDIVAYTLDLGIAAKQRLLDEPDVDRRAELLLTTLTGLSVPGASQRPGDGQFPPGFSQN